MQTAFCSLEGVLHCNDRSIFGAIRYRWSAAVRRQSADETPRSRVLVDFQSSWSPPGTMCHCRRSLICHCRPTTLEQSTWWCPVCPITNYFCHPNKLFTIFIPVDVALPFLSYWSNTCIRTSFTLCCILTFINVMCCGPRHFWHSIYIVSIVPLFLLLCVDFTCAKVLHERILLLLLLLLLLRLPEQMCRLPVLTFRPNCHSQVTHVSVLNHTVVVVPDTFML